MEADRRRASTAPPRSWRARRRTHDRPHARQPRFVAGAIGPTNRTLSMSPDVNDPGFRAVSFDEVRDTYVEQVRGLIDGGVDMLLVETIFDTLNAKAALAAIAEVFEDRGVAPAGDGLDDDHRASGRTLSGQTVEAFWTSIAHARPWSVGVNCALGRRAMRPYVEALSRIGDCWSAAIPNAGLPNAFGGYDDCPSTPPASCARWSATAGSTWSAAAAGRPPTISPRSAGRSRRHAATSAPERHDGDDASGRAGAVRLRPGQQLHDDGRTDQRDRLEADSPRWSRRRVHDRPGGGRRPGPNGANILDVNMDEAMLDAKRR